MKQGQKVQIRETITRSEIPLFHAFILLFKKIFILISLPIFFSTGCTTAPRHNVILITVDTLRFDHLGYTGYNKIQTPHIDKLAENALIFKKAYSSVPLTLPSHVSILTGTYPPFNGVRDNGIFYLRPQFTTLAEIFRDHGYNTGAVIGSVVLNKLYGVGQGFDFYEDRIQSKEKFKDSPSERNAESVNKIVFDWFGKRDRRPFFLWIHYYDPHTPYDPHKHLFHNRYEKFPYNGEVAYVDIQIGKLVDFLSRENLLKNTLIVFTSDHGESFGEHYEYSHGFFIYDSTLRVPLFFYFPEKIDKKIVENQVSLVDVMPTILDICYIKCPTFLHGKSLIRSIKNTPLYCETFLPNSNYGWSPLKGIVSQEWKYISAPKPELYNLTEDPNEEKNMLTMLPDKAKRMTRIYNKFVKDLKPNKDINSKRRISREEEVRLRSLGYMIQPSSNRQSSNEISQDPKNMIHIRNQIKDAESLLTREARAADERGGELGQSPSLKFLESIVDKGYKTLWAYIVVYDTYARMGKYEKAIEIAEKALKISPNDYRVLRDLGLIYRDTRNYLKAIDLFKRAKKQIPDDFFVNWEIARINFQMKNYEDALGEFKALIDGNIDEDYIEAAYEYCGHICIELKRYSEAIVFFKKIEKPLPEGLNVCWNLAKLYYITKEYKKSLEAFTTLIKGRLDNDKRYLAYVYLGNIYSISITRSDRKNALIYFKKALSLSKDPAERQNISRVIEKLESSMKD
jgi:arylsulfatase A-like enzyme/Tfp pilus assembly protein PilF